MKYSSSSGTYKSNSDDSDKMKDLDHAVYEQPVVRGNFYKYDNPTMPPKRQKQVTLTNSNSNSDDTGSCPVVSSHTQKRKRKQKQKRQNNAANTVHKVLGSVKITLTNSNSDSVDTGSCHVVSSHTLSQGTTVFACIIYFQYFTFIQVDIGLNEVYITK